MTNPSLLAMEQAFEKRLETVSEATWLETRIARLDELTRWLATQLPPDQQPAYRPELLPYLVLITDRLQSGAWINLHPRYFRMLMDLYGHFPDSDENRYRLQILAAHLYRLHHWLNQTDGNENLIRLLVPEKDRVLPEDPREQRNFLRHHGSRHVSGILTAMEIPSQFDFPSPSVPGLFIQKDQGLIVGKLAKVTLLSVKLSSSLGLDQIRISTHLVDEQDVLAEQTRALCAYFRNLGVFPPDQYLRAEYTLDQPASLLKGNSIGAALALISIDKLKNYKRNPALEQRIYGDVGITGAVDATGNILPVEERTLPQKIEAAFFSPLRSVIIPDVQQSLARQHLNRLRKEFPARELGLIPAGTMDRLQRNRQVVIWQRRRMLQRVRQLAGDYSNSVTLIILGFVVMVALGFWFGVVKYPAPETTTFEKNHLVVRNRYGFKLWKSDLGGYKGLVDDIDNDGRREVLVGYSCIIAKSVHCDGRLVCYDAAGNELWHQVLGMEITYGQNTYPNNFDIAWLGSDDLDQDGLKEIIGVASNVYFPTRVAVLNQTGKLISDFWNSGNIYDLLIHELYAGNTTREIVVAGVNNEDRRGILFVLDPFDSHGSSPQANSYYQNSALPRGNAIYYLKFPPSHFKQQSGYQVSLDIINNLGVSGTDLKAELFHEEPGQTRPKFSGGSVIYQFNPNMAITFVDLSDGYYTNYQREFPELEPLQYNDPGLIDYYRGVEYWDGENWVKGRALNREYGR